jgi:hypothetical protein
MRGISLTAELFLDYGEGLCFMQLIVRCLVRLLASLLNYSYD